MNVNAVIPIYVRVDGNSLGVFECEIATPAGAFEIIDFVIGTDWIGQFNYNPTFGNDVVVFGGLIDTFSNPSRVHIGDITVKPLTIGTMAVMLSITSLSEKSTVVTNIGTMVGSDSDSSQHAIVVKSARRSLENEFRPVERRIKRATTQNTFGDINCDGVFDINDVQFLSLTLPSYLADPTVLTDVQIALSDSDLNDNINFNDVLYLLRVRFGLLPFLSDFVVRPSDDPFSNCVLRVSVTATDADNIPITSNLVIYALFITTDSDFHTEYDQTTLAHGAKTTSTGGAPTDGKWVILASNPNTTGNYLVETNLNNISSTDIGVSLHIAYFDANNGLDGRTAFLTGIQNGVQPEFSDFNDNLPMPGPSSVPVEISVDFKPLRLFDNTVREFVCFNFFSPSFLQPVYSITQTLPEDHPIYSIIATVQATDQDTNINGDIIYSISNYIYQNTTPIAVDPLLVGPENGSVYIVSELDRDSYSSFDAVILAIDQGPHLSSRKTATTTVRVLSIQDINDNAPQADPSYVFGVSENAVVNSFVGSIPVVDSDATSPNNLIQFSAISSGPFQISQQGTITLFRPVDADNGNPTQYNFTVIINDLATVNRLMVSTIVTVNVQDVNDLRPEFLPPFDISIPENTSPGSAIATIMARDNDTDPLNRRFEYSITQVNPLDNQKQILSQSVLSDAIFSIDMNTGVLTLEKVC